MPSLYPNLPFNEGDEWTPDLAYLSCTVPIFDDQPQFLGHRERLLDAELSDNPTQIKARFGAVENAFKVTHVSGLTVRVEGGLAVLPGGVSTFERSPVTLAVANNATTFVWIDVNGVVTSGATLPVIRSALAEVIAASGTVQAIRDLRRRDGQWVRPSYASIRSFGGQNLTDITCTNGQTLADGVYFCRNFTVPAGVTVTIARWADIYASGNVTIAGTVVVTSLLGGTIGRAVSLGANGSVETSPGTGLGGNLTTYPARAQAHGSGGGGGAAATTTGASIMSTSGGGSGGGHLTIEAAGVLNVTGVITCDGGNGSAGTWAGFSASNNLVLGGSGGGSGGSVWLSSLTRIDLTAGAVINIRGGNGSAGQRWTTAGWNAWAMGGSGGSGGVLTLMSPTVNNNATVNRSGGAWGAHVGLTTVNATTLRVNRTWVGGLHGVGGSFTDLGGFSSSVEDGADWLVTLTPAQQGSIIVRNFVPIS